MGDREHRKELDINHLKMKSMEERTQELPHMTDNALREIDNEKKLLQKKNEDGNGFKGRQQTQKIGEEYQHMYNRHPHEKKKAKAREKNTKNHNLKDCLKF